jgi:hypothetical protein
MIPFELFVRRFIAVSVHRRSESAAAQSYPAGGSAPEVIGIERRLLGAPYVSESGRGRQWRR